MVVVMTILLFNDESFVYGHFVWSTGHTECMWGTREVLRVEWTLISVASRLQHFDNRF
jgi:hypothetical protein